MKDNKLEFKQQARFLELLSEKFPNIRSAKTEIINLEAILNLPKVTEHFLSDIHGEYETFKHILSNGSGVIRRRIHDIFGDQLSKEEQDRLATLIYYPAGYMDKLEIEGKITEAWIIKHMNLLIQLASHVSSKYTRSKVRKSLPPDFGYIIDELLNINRSIRNKDNYYSSIIQSIIRNETAYEFIYELAHLIQRLSIDRLHIVGDIFDRGPQPDKVMDELMMFPNVDIQWGNHDVVWMGAAAGIEVYIAIVIRISARYNNLDVLEEAYGINLFPLYEFAQEVYGEDQCSKFKGKNRSGLTKKQEMLIRKVHKAISIIQFKLEDQIIKRNPDFRMNNRIMMENIDLENNTICIDGEDFPLNDANFPTLDSDSPCTLSPEEAELMSRLKKSFMKSEKLQKHINFMYSKGSMYLCFNDLLLYHGAIPVSSKGKLKEIEIDGKAYKGKALLDQFDLMARQAYYNKDHQLAKDYLWYLWCGPNSPLFGKKKMATFERYFIDDKSTHKEDRKAYYRLREDESVLERIIKDFDLDPKKARIVNGHVPVKIIKGEQPVKANGRLIVIDGGMSKAYQSVTGIAGFTLISNSYGLVLVSHQSFKSKKEAIENMEDIVSSSEFLDEKASRKTVRETDVGIDLLEQVEELKFLVEAYKKGLIKEKHKK